MADTLRFTILGCGSSPGTPRATGDWGNCDPTNPRNRRSRAALLVERISPAGKTTVVVDTGPDFRLQMIDAGVSHIDGVVYTHAHADHIHGIDDLRSFVFHQRRRIDIHADARTMERLWEGFGYCFKTPIGSAYPPILTPILIEPDEPVRIDGAGGAVTFIPLPQVHGDIPSLGFRIGNVAYCPDVSDFPTPTVELLLGLDVLIIDALQYRTHPSHLSLSQALGWIERLQPKRALLTHMHIPLDYAAVTIETPEHVQPAYDGLVFETPQIDPI